MSRIALLIKATPQFEDDNYLRFAKCLSRSHDITLIPVESLRLIDNQVCGGHLSWQSEFTTGMYLPDTDIKPIDHDLLWILSLGEQRSFLDKYQLLYALSKKVRVINSLEALMHLNSKYYLTTRPQAFPQPETHAGRNAAELAQIINSKGGMWIVKPPAGSLGRDVFLVNPSDTNLNSILEHMCGKEHVDVEDVSETQASRDGLSYWAADGGEIANYGEVRVNMVAFDSSGAAHKVTSRFEAADVTRALWSVGLICDSGLKVDFNSSRAVVSDQHGR